MHEEEFDAAFRLRPFGTPGASGRPEVHRITRGYFVGQDT
jgi:hypothetical protein